MDWYYADASDNQIKFEESELSSLISSEKIHAKTLIWNKTMDDWKQASLVKPELFQLSVNSTASNVGSQPYVPAPYNPNAPVYHGPPTDGFSITSMVLGILGVMTMCAYGIGLVPGVGALIFGYISKKEVRDTSGHPKVSGMAMAGIIMGYVAVVVGLLWAVLIGIGIGFASFA